MNVPRLLTATRCFRLFLLLTLLLPFAMPSPASASQGGGILRIAVNGLTAGDCGAWEKACSLPYALQIASSGDTLWVQSGTYITGSGPRNAIRMKSGVSMYGGFHGEELQRDERDWLRYPTILSGDIGGDDLPDGTQTGINSYHVVIARNMSETTVLDGFIISGGNATNFVSSRPGGGILIQGGSPALSNLIIRYNQAVQGGGVGCSHNSTPLLMNVRFEQNRAVDGGGFYASKDCMPALYGTAFTANRADYGGAIRSDSEKAVLQNGSISGNNARVEGGAVYNSQGDLLITNSILWGNHKDQSGSEIANDGGTVTALYNLVSGGFAGEENFDSNPSFVTDPNSGQDGLWGTPDDVPGNLDLRYLSPAIDAGENNLVPAALTRDLNNWPRFIDHPRPDTAAEMRVDLGAYEAGVLFVHQSASGANDGSSWTDAYTELRDALSASLAGDEVWVAAGTYLPAGTPEQSFRLPGEVAVYGGFAGNETFRDQRDWDANNTILSGDTGAKEVTADNAYHVVSAADVDSTTVLDGFTIRDGNASGTDAPSGSGGGLYLWNASPSLYNLTITANQARSGGGLFSQNGEPSLTNTLFTGNQAAQGGGCALIESDAQLVGITFQGNLADGSGGGLYNNGSEYSIRSGVFVGNSSLSGAGIYNAGAGEPRLVDVIFSGNAAASSGGGMFNTGLSKPDLSNAIFTGNRAVYAGGIYSNGGSLPALRNVTLAGNHGGAFYSYSFSQAGQSAFLANVIAWNNGIHPFSIYYSSPQMRYSLLEGGCPGFARCDFVLSVDPMLSRLPGAGADGQWGSQDDDYGDLRLMPGSPAIDAGDSSAVLSGITTDIVGSPRFIDNPHALDLGFGSPVVDMGAYEANLAPTTVAIQSVTPMPSVTGETVTISFAVTGSTGEPEGTVTIFGDGLSCSAPAASGTCQMTFFSSGDKNLEAVYSGSPSDEPSHSDVFLHTVIPASTSITLTLDPSQPDLGQPVQFNYQVAPAAPGAGQPTGTVIVTIDGSEVCQGSAAQGSCTGVFSTLGFHRVAATYLGDANYQAASSESISLDVQQILTTIEILSITPERPVTGQEVLVRFAVTTALGDPEGMVTITAGDYQCSAPAVQGECRIVFTTAGQKALLGSFTPDGHFNPATSTEFLFEVLPAATIIQLDTPPDQQLTVGTAIPISFVLTVAAPGAGIPTGIVEISDGTNRCTASAAESGCILAINTPGARPLTARYLGDENFLGSTSTEAWIQVEFRILLPIISHSP